eukprot:TRINITY_DN102360_c0_g1_i1.p1 TRINITY_DN102360_c0_g1~~TRINITY_DN102360_c0_g1_i1.p1  ORF type:complete len:578 (+),score=121.82 TRINITY_DN102360_c0_g1_i1:122-1855(+)
MAAVMPAEEYIRRGSAKTGGSRARSCTTPTPSRLPAASLLPRTRDESALPSRKRDDSDSPAGAERSEGDLGRGYTLVKTLGKGGFGTASVVTDRRGERWVMKTVTVPDQKEEGKADVINEAAIHSQLVHPCVVRLREFFVQEGVLSIVMEYATGGDLKTRIDTLKTYRDCFAENQILAFFARATVGLDYIHRRRVLHRDLKSRNLFLHDTDELVIGDFGNSLSLGAHPEFIDGRFVGTLHYLAPEVIDKRIYSRACDVWSLGCVLHEMIMLQMPYTTKKGLERSDARKQLLEMQRTEVPPELRPYYSTGLRTMSESLLKFERDERPSCSQLLELPVLQAYFQAQMGSLLLPGTEEKLLWVGKDSYRATEKSPRSQWWWQAARSGGGDDSSTVASPNKEMSSTMYAESTSGGGRQSPAGFESPAATRGGGGGGETLRGGRTSSTTPASKRDRSQSQGGMRGGGLALTQLPANAHANWALKTKGDPVSPSKVTQDKVTVRSLSAAGSGSRRGGATLHIGTGREMLLQGGAIRVARPTETAARGTKAADLLATQVGRTKRTGSVKPLAHHPDLLCPTPPR